MRDVYQKFNKKLVSIQKTLTEISTKDGAYDSIAQKFDIQSVNSLTAKQAEALREKLFLLRQQVRQAEEESLQDKSLQSTIQSFNKLTYEMLMLLAEYWPKNKSNRLSVLKCPINDETLTGKTVVILSNGCYYDDDAFDQYRGGNKIVPHLLPGSQYPIAKEDLKAIDKKLNLSVNHFGANIGIVVAALTITAFPVLNILVKMLAGITLFGAMEAGLLALGVGAGVAAVTPLAMGFLLAVGAGVAAFLLTKKYFQKYSAHQDNSPLPTITPAEKFTTAKLGVNLGKGNVVQLDDVKSSKSALAAAPASPKKPEQELSSDEDEVIDETTENQPLLPKSSPRATGS